MAYTAAHPITLMQLWRLHKRECRAIGSIVADARAGTLPGVETLPSGIGFAVTDQHAALGAMRRTGVMLGMMNKGGGQQLQAREGGNSPRCLASIPRLLRSCPRGLAVCRHPPLQCWKIGSTARSQTSWALSLPRCDIAVAGVRLTGIARH